MSDESPEVHTRELRKRKVVSTSTAETVASVKGLVINPAASTVTGVQLKSNAGDLVPFSAIDSIGPDAVTVPDTSEFVHGKPGSPTTKDVYGHRLIDDAGTEHGKVKDLIVNVKTGSIVGVIVGKETIRCSLLGVGSYAVVIRTVS